MIIISRLIYAFSPYIEKLTKEFPEFEYAQRVITKLCESLPKPFCPYYTESIKTNNERRFRRCADPLAEKCHCSFRWQTPREGDKKHSHYWDCKK